MNPEERELERQRSRWEALHARNQAVIAEAKTCWRCQARALMAGGGMESAPIDWMCRRHCEAMIANVAAEDPIAAAKLRSVI